MQNPDKALVKILEVSRIGHSFTTMLHALRNDSSLQNTVESYISSSIQEMEDNDFGFPPVVQGVSFSFSSLVMATIKGCCESIKRLHTAGYPLEKIFAELDTAGTSKHPFKDTAVYLIRGLFPMDDVNGDSLAAPFYKILSEFDNNEKRTLFTIFLVSIQEYLFMLEAKGDEGLVNQHLQSIGLRYAQPPEAFL